VGRRRRIRASSEALARVLDELVDNGASCVVIENAFALRSDPGLARYTQPAAFTGDNVLHWTELARGTAAAAVDTIWASSSGYPRNAFVVAKSCAELRLADRAQVDENLPDVIVESLLAVVVSAYDAESFLVWTPA
jgi:hypothetical protein